MMNTVPALTALAIGTAVLGGAPDVARAADLEVEVGNVRVAEGDLRIAVYADAANFRKQAVRQMQLPAQAPATLVRIADLTPGDYAIALYQDRNRNEKLDSNLLGIPSEPYGFSGGSARGMGPPAWDQARFAFGPEATRIVIQLSD